MVRRLLGACAVLGLGLGSTLLTSCGQTASPPEPGSAAGAAGGLGAGTGSGARAGAGGGGLVIGVGGAETGPAWFCHPNTTPRSREDTTPSCTWINSCDGVQCAYGSTHEVLYALPALTCRQGNEVGLPAGGCCYDCVSDQEQVDVVTCVDACPDAPPSCPIGYRAATVPGACCLECVVDQDYCNSDADCVLAKRPANCCGCVEAVSVRRLDADDCYTSVSVPRATPDSCPTDYECALVLCGCPGEAPSSAACVDRHCVAL